MVYCPMGLCEASHDCFNIFWLLIIYIRTARGLKVGMRGKVVFTYVWGASCLYLLVYPPGLKVQTNVCMYIWRTTSFIHVCSKIETSFVEMYEGQVHLYLHVYLPGLKFWMNASLFIQVGKFVCTYICTGPPPPKGWSLNEYEFFRASLCPVSAAVGLPSTYGHYTLPSLTDIDCSMVYLPCVTGMDCIEGVKELLTAKDLQFTRLKIPALLSSYPQQAHV